MTMYLKETFGDDIFTAVRAQLETITDDDLLIEMCGEAVHARCFERSFREHGDEPRASFEARCEQDVAERNFYNDSLSDREDYIDMLVTEAKRINACETDGSVYLDMAHDNHVIVSEIEQLCEERCREQF